MTCYFSVCSTYMYHSAYIDYLLKHYTDLRLPYSFPVSLSYISSPLLTGREAVLAFNDEEQIVGAFGYIHGTGEQEYKDEHIIQIQVVHILKAYRGTGLFLHGLQFLLEHLSLQRPAVRELRFWVPNRQDHHKLFSKFATPLANLSTGKSGDPAPVEEYRLTIEELKTFLANFKTRSFI